MPKFSYLALDAEGLQISDTVRADSMALAIKQIRNLGYFPTNLKEEDAPGMKAGRGFFPILFRRKARNLEIARFIRELSDMLGAGISLPFSLSILHDRQQSGRLKNILGKLAADVASGMKFSEALAKHPKIFDALFVAMVRAGEDGGSLEPCLARLANVYKQLETDIGRLKGRARKGSIGLIAGLALSAYLLYFLKALYDAGNFALIFSIRRRSDHFLNVASDMADTIVFVIGFIVVMKLLLRIRFIRRIKDALVLKSPSLRRKALKKRVAQIFRIIGTLLQNGIPLQQALDATCKRVENPAMIRALNNISERLREGETLEDALADSHIFPPTAVDMIAAGEQAGNIGSMMLEVAETYDSESRARADRLSDSFFVIVVFLFSAVVASAVLSSLFN